MKKFLIPRALAATALLAALALAGSASAQEKVDAKLQAKAKLTRVEAEKIALAAVPNATVKSAELEEEDGILRWSFDLKTPHTKNVTEVGVDAVTGKVVENKEEKAEDEAKEKKHEKKEKED